MSLIPKPPVGTIVVPNVTKGDPPPNQRCLKCGMLPAICGCADRDQRRAELLQRARSRLDSMTNGDLSWFLEGK